MRAIQSNKAPVPIGPYSQAIQSGDHLYISGQLPIDPVRDIMVTDITNATHQVMKNLEHILGEAGLQIKDIIKVSVFLKKMRHFKKFNETYQKYLTLPFPARTVIEVSALPNNAVIEMDAIAFIQKN